MSTAALLLAAGTSDRFGGDTPKQLATLAGEPLLTHSLRALEASGVVDETMVVTSERLLELVQAVAARHDATVVVGGTTRTDSVRRGLGALRGSDDELILVHDAARPLIDPKLIRQCVQALARNAAVTLAMPIADTLLEASATSVIGTADRDGVVAAQTPQGFRLGLLRAAHEAAALMGLATTDDCSLVLTYDPAIAVAIVPGSPTNLKITTPDDLAIAEALLAARSEEPQHG